MILASLTVNRTARDFRQGTGGTEQVEASPSCREGEGLGVLVLLPHCPHRLSDGSPGGCRP